MEYFNITLSFADDRSLSVTVKDGGRGVPVCLDPAYGHSDHKQEKVIAIFLESLRILLSDTDDWKTLTDDQIKDCLSDHHTVFHTPTRYDLNAGGGGYYNTEEFDIKLPEPGIEITRLWENQ